MIEFLQQEPGWLLLLLAPALQPIVAWLWELRRLVYRFFIHSYSISNQNSRFYLYQTALMRLVPNARSLKETDTPSQGPSWWEGANQTRESEVQPDYGSYWFRFEGVLVYAIYEEGEQKKSSDGKTGGQRELISFAFLTRRREPVRAFREYVRGLEREKRQSITTIWTNHWSSWVPTARRHPRPDSTLFYEDDLHVSLLRDLEHFRGAADAYHLRGRVHKRGYLLHGPPGNGKTTMVLWLASKVGMDVALLSSRVDDERFLSLVSTLPRASILVLEDVDALLVSSHSRASEEGGESASGDDDKEVVSLSLLLNYLDGMLSREGQVVFLTTNFPDKLDKAIRRKGRADRSVFLGPLSSDVVVKMYEANYVLPAPDELRAAYDALPAAPSIADLEDHFQSHSPQEALAQFSKLAPESLQKSKTLSESQASTDKRETAQNPAPETLEPAALPSEEPEDNPTHQSPVDPQDV